MTLLKSILVVVLLLAGSLWLYLGDSADDSRKNAVSTTSITEKPSISVPKRHGKSSRSEPLPAPSKEDQILAAPERNEPGLHWIPGMAIEETPPGSEPSVIHLTPHSSPTATVPAPSPTASASLSDLHLEALREMQRLSQNNGGSSRIGGVRSGTSKNLPPVSTATSTPTATPTATGTVLSRVSGQPRGFTLLALMHPRARPSMEKSIQTLLESEVGSLYLGVLTDGSFEKDFTYLKDVVTRLNANGRNLTLALYLTNGASMRRYDDAVFTAGFNLIEPETFRYLITYYDEIRNEFQSMTREVKPVFELNRSLNPANRNIAIMMLEDNLDRASYVAMRELAKPALAGVAEFIRNPCAGCYDGNDADSAGDGLESHSVGDLITLGTRDGFSMDGTSYAFPGEPADVNQLGFEQVKVLMNEASSRRLGYFGLWRAGKQGLGSVMVPADQRIYEVTTEEQSKLEIELLRHGLE